MTAERPICELLSHDAPSHKAHFYGFALEMVLNDTNVDEFFFCEMVVFCFPLWLSDWLKQPVKSYREDGLQFFSVDLPVAVLIKQFEIPLELLIDFSFQQQADGGDVLHKVDVTILQTEETVTTITAGLVRFLFRLTFSPFWKIC